MWVMMGRALTMREGLRERAEASLGRERIWEQTRSQVLLTQAAAAKDKAGNLARMFWIMSSFKQSIPSNLSAIIFISLLVGDNIVFTRWSITGLYRTRGGKRCVYMCVFLPWKSISASNLISIIIKKVTYIENFNWILY